MVLVRLATNDAWASLVEGVSKGDSKEGCSEEVLPGNCGAPYAVAALFFISFVGNVSMIMINLVRFVPLLLHGACILSNSIDPALQFVYAITLRITPSCAWLCILSGHFSPLRSPCRLCPSFLITLKRFRYASDLASDHLAEFVTEHQSVHQP